MKNEFRAAYDDMDKLIINSTRQALAKFNPPKSYNIKTLGADYEKGWVTGFRRCLAEVEKAVKSKDEVVQ